MCEDFLYGATYSMVSTILKVKNVYHCLRQEFFEIAFLPLMWAGKSAFKLRTS